MDKTDECVVLMIKTESSSKNYRMNIELNNSNKKTITKRIKKKKKKKKKGIPSGKPGVFIDEIKPKKLQAENGF